MTDTREVVSLASLLPIAAAKYAEGTDAIAAAKRADDDATDRANAHARSVSYARGALISTDRELTRAHHARWVAAQNLQRALVDHFNAFDAYVAALDSTDTED